MLGEEFALVKPLDDGLLAPDVGKGFVLKTIAMGGVLWCRMH
jgi:hypothetical protein